ncbi:ABC-2 type transport system ATP-binding protein [Mycoplasma testudineum]|uniref:ABC-2 type transport system ATP-binding protein n=1 Tax=Mycoplasma testudineum TaxID=244584 RepID=A0A4R6IFW8_9MOLU|nr:ABC transporter ATP-binding protein [Mycoplasma testudineum]OYD26999.1 multidrug ABC transporter ATP-binding protein [Mycoplasma testudineum]TDO20547.1 ABC-2 type transport system ATP-binding protein [Mycoplasma testudineum]
MSENVSNYTLEISNLKYKHSKKDKFEIDIKTLNLKKGKFYGFIGPNGAGKTTLIRCIIGAYPSFQGLIKINSISNKIPTSRYNLGYVPEAEIFAEKQTVYQFLYYSALMSGIKTNEAKLKIEKNLVEFKMDQYKNRKAKSLSSGQKKRLLLIQALINEPDILVLDEPAANLDPSSRYEFFTYLKQIQKQGKTVFISSHILSELEQYIDEYILFKEGKIVSTGVLDGKSQKEGNSYTILINNDHIENMQQLLTKLGIAFENVDNEFKIETLDSSAVLSLQSEIISHKIEMLEFKKKERKLQDVYNIAMEVE